MKTSVKCGIPKGATPKERLVLHRAPVLMTSAELKGVESFERLLERMDDDLRTKDNDIDRRKTFKAMQKTLETASAEERQGLLRAITEYIAMTEDGFVPPHGFVSRVLQHGEWFPENA